MTKDGMFRTIHDPSYRHLNRLALANQVPCRVDAPWLTDANHWQKHGFQRSKQPTWDSYTWLTCHFLGPLSLCVGRAAVAGAF